MHIHSILVGERSSLHLSTAQPFDVPCPELLTLLPDSQREVTSVEVRPNMSIHQFFILSPRGDSIITKDFRGDAPIAMHDAFFHKVDR